jgi:hypothetical protein
VAAKAPTYSDQELEALSSQMDLQGTIEDLTHAYMEEELVKARIDRDESVLLYYMTRQTRVIGADHTTSNGKDKYELHALGLNFVASPNSKTTTNHSAVYAQLQDHLNYYREMEVQTQEAMEKSNDYLEVSQLHNEYLGWKAKREVLEEVFSIKEKNTSTSISNNLSLRVTVDAPEEGETPALPKRRTSKSGVKPID